MFTLRCDMASPERAFDTDNASQSISARVGVETARNTDRIIA